MEEQLRLINKELEERRRMDRLIIKELEERRRMDALLMQGQTYRNLG